MNPKADILLKCLDTAREKTPIRTIIEIGSIREVLESPTEGYSTLYLAQKAVELGAQLHSVNIDDEALATAYTVLINNKIGGNFDLIHDDGLNFLKNFQKPIDFLYLDGSDDPVEAYDQFVAAQPRLNPNAIICIDDCHEYGGNGFGKGTEILLYAHSLRYKGRVVSTYGPYQTAVLWGYNSDYKLGCD